MSSSHGNAFTAGNAVDGDKHTESPYIIHTATNKSQPFAWWTVDLETDVQNATVMIYFRTDNSDRRNGVMLYTSTKPFSSYPGGQWCHTFTGENLAVVSISCTGSWQYLLIFRNTTNGNDAAIAPVLDFAEVEVLACSTGTYGSDCTKECGFRQCVESSSSCNRSTGACSNQGCKAGSQGTDCTETCPIPTYGPNCHNDCASRKCVEQSSTCDRISGECSSEGCTPGYQETDCTQNCTSGTYGNTCNGNCASRQCAVTPTSCNHITGACPPGGCKTGWKGDDCFQVCPTDTYGASCQHYCISRHCVVNSSSCDRFTGACPGECEDGWQATDCTTECTPSTYGPACRMTCANRKCNISSSACDHIFGQCLGGCVTGWNGRDCTEAIGSVGEESALIPAVAGAVAAILVIAIIVIVVIMFRRRRRAASAKNHQQNGIQSALTMDNVNGYGNMELEGEKKQNPHSLPTKQSQPEVIADSEQEEDVLEDDEPPPAGDYYNVSDDVLGEIPVEDLAAVVQKVKQKKVGFEAEYNRLPAGFTASYRDSQKAENAGKNKFRGYYPYDYNRIRLTPLPDVPGSDYINASLMHSHNQRKAYIAAQAPNKKTVGDFWRMIWEKRCQRVIMLTGLVEDMKPKCYQYWPTQGIMDTDQFKIEVKVTDTRANYTIRHIKVKSKENGECRSVVQYHFTYWPDHGVPDTLALVHFIWMIRQTDTSGDGPLLVHCSAGIGRTGTYIAVDSLLDQAREEGVVDVLGYVSVMRGQRKNMIQTKEQYECVFDCLVEMTTYGNTSMDVENLTTSFTSRGMDSMTDRKTLRELTQMTITEERNDNPDRHMMWVNGNQDYIVRVGPTLRQRKGYMMSVVPPPGLEKLLWKLVEENNVQNIIVISQLQMDLVDSKGSTKEFGDIKVTTISQTNLTPELTLVNQKLQVTNKDNSTSVKLFKFDGSPTLDSMSSCLLNHAHIQHLSGEITPVVIIHSETDRKCAVLVCIMGNILSGILEDRRIDVIGHVRTFLKCCPDLTFTEEDVEQLHEFAQKCVQMTEASNTYANM